MKYLRNIISVFFICLFVMQPVLATNTHSVDFELSSTQYAGITDASQTGLDLTNSTTIQFWLNPESFADADYNSIISKNSGFNANGSFEVIIYRYAGGGDFLFRFEVSSGTGNETWGHHFLATTSIWTNFTVSWKVNEVKFYINGILKETFTGGTIATMNNSAAPFRLGKDDSFLTQYDGKMDDVRVWNQVLSAADILDNYNRELTTAEIASSSLVGYWKLDNNYLDETANNNDLTAVNSPTFTTDVPFSGGGGAPTQGNLKKCIKV